MATLLSKKGQVVLPAKIRAKYGLKPGDPMLVEEQDGRIVVVPLLRDPIHELQGILKKFGPGTPELLADRRWEEQHEREQELAANRSR